MSKDNVVAFHTTYKRITQSNSAAIFLSQLVWLMNTHGQDFFSSDTYIMEKTALTEKELRNAKNKLKGLGLITITLGHVGKSANKVSHYYIHLNVLRDLASEHCSEDASEVGRGCPKGMGGGAQRADESEYSSSFITPKGVIQEEIMCEPDVSIRKQNAMEYAKHPEFDRLWEASGRRGDKKPAFNYWKKNKKKLPDVDELIKIMEQQVYALKKNGGHAKFRPHLVNWLTRSAWENIPEVEEPKRIYKNPGVRPK